MRSVYSVGSTLRNLAVFAHVSGLSTVPRVAKSLSLGDLCPAIVMQVWVVDDGRITNYNGYFEDYRDELHKEIAAELDEEERLAAERVAERAAAKAAKGGRK